MDSFTMLRPATQDDAVVIGKLHATSWMIAYRGLLSDEYLDNDLAGERMSYWSKKLKAMNDDEFVLLAVGPDGDAAGFIAVMDQPEAGYSALVDNLHVRPDLKGQGIGKALMQRAASKLLASGRSSYYLWVLNGNDPACRFYESIGGRAADETIITFGGKDVKRTRYVWDSFEHVLKQAPAE